MATYDYECTACGHVFEAMHGMTEPVLRKCPKCKKLKLRRLISGGAGVIFKGSGFYETDYKRNRRGAGSASKTKDEGPDGAPKGEAKPESKGEAKGETKSEPRGETKSDTGREGKRESRSDAKSEGRSQKDSGAKKD